MIGLIARLLLAAAFVPDAVPLAEAPVATEGGEIPVPVVVPLDPPGPATAFFGPPDSLAPPPPPRPEIPEVLPFGKGERLVFSIDYGFINAGWATMEVRDIRRISGFPCFDIGTEAKSNSFFSKFYKVWDRAQTFLDVETVLPRRFEKKLREGTFKKDVKIKFDRDREFAWYEKKSEEVIVHPWAQDELSAFYYLRTLPLEVGRDVFIDSHSDHKNYPLKVIIHRRETIEVGAGTFDCWVIEPVIREGGIFTAKGTLTIWITADERRMPVKMETKILVGSIGASLVEYREGERYRREPGEPARS